MTGSTQNIDTLEGEALAAAVAERVMGWVELHGCWYNPNGGASDGRKHLIADFRPDLNVAQAWEVFEKLRELDCDISLESCGSGWCLGSSWLFVKHYSPISETAPLAICRSALIAVEAAR